MTYWRELARHYDYVFTIQTDPCLEAMRAGDATRGSPTCRAPSTRAVHRPLVLDAAERAELGSDVSASSARATATAGSRSGASLDLDFRIWGSDWGGAEGLGRGASSATAPASTTEDSVRIFNASTINLNLHSSTYLDGRRSARRLREPAHVRARRRRRVPARRPARAPAAALRGRHASSRSSTAWRRCGSRPTTTSRTEDERRRDGGPGAHARARGAHVPPPHGGPARRRGRARRRSVCSRAAAPRPSATWRAAADGELERLLAAASTRTTPFTLDRARGEPRRPRGRAQRAGSDLPLPAPVRRALSPGAPVMSGRHVAKLERS